MADKHRDEIAIINIRPIVGGDNALLFVSDLVRMYRLYATANGWSISRNDNEVTFSVKGKGAYSRLKYESGIHRVHRISVAGNQISTSTVVVSVTANVSDPAVGNEKVRTYNYPQNRVTDHRIDLDVFNLAAVMSGDLDRFN